MAYRRQVRASRARSTRSYGGRGSGRRTSRRTIGRRSTGRSSGTVVRLVIEQPSASTVSRPELIGMTARPSRKASF